MVDSVGLVVVGKIEGGRLDEEGIPNSQDGMRHLMFALELNLRSMWMLDFGSVDGLEMRVEIVMVTKSRSLSS